MTPQRIQLRRTKGWRMPPNTVKVDRTTKWGNPWPADHEGTAMHCLSIGLSGQDATDRKSAAVDLYRRWVTGGKVNELVSKFLARPTRDAPLLRHIQRDLRGKNLACWCKLPNAGEPDVCHAAVLLELANRPEEK